MLPVFAGIVAGVILKWVLNLNRKWTLLLVLGLSLLVGVLGYFLAPRQTVDNVVSGVVRDEATQETIPGAIVNVLDRHESQKTDSSGNFHLNLIAPFPKIVRLEVAASGYSAKEFDVRPPQHSLAVQLQRIKK